MQDNIEGNFCDCAVSREISLLRMQGWHYFIFTVLIFFAIVIVENQQNYLITKKESSKYSYLRSWNQRIIKKMTPNNWSNIKIDGNYWSYFMQLFPPTKKTMYGLKNILSVLTYDPLEVCAGGCICRDPALCLHFLITLWCSGFFTDSKRHYLMSWKWDTTLNSTLWTDPTDSTFNSRQLPN